MVEPTEKVWPDILADISSVNLSYYEQQVNDREATSPAPKIDKRLLPESGVMHPLAWRKIPRRDVKIFSTVHKSIEPILPLLMRDSFVLMPVHPLSEHRYSADELVYSGKIQFSASYRTVFYEPEPEGILGSWIPDGKTLMLKLSLEEPLPGIPGDRRLTRDKIEKCILMSDALPDELRNDPLASRLEIIPEFFGISAKDSGVIFRLLPASGLLPVFSLYSFDRNKPQQLPVIVRHLQYIYQGNSAALVADLGEQLAKPLVQSLLAGFRIGFSLEMHAQNTLFSPCEKSLFDRVYFRDLEGVVFSNKFRADRGLNPLFVNCENSELIWKGKSMRPWFNRNLDHDLGRIFGCSLDALLRHGVIDQRGKSIAVASIRNSVRKAVQAAELQATNWPGSIIPYSRAPWGNGLRPGHYFRTRFR